MKRKRSTLTPMEAHCARFPVSTDPTTASVQLCRHVCMYARDIRACKLAASLLVNCSAVMFEASRAHLYLFIERQGGWLEAPWWQRIDVSSSPPHTYAPSLHVGWARGDIRHVLSCVDAPEFLTVAAEYAPDMTRAMMACIAWDPAGEPIYRRTCARTLVSSLHGLPPA